VPALFGAPFFREVFVRSEQDVSRGTTAQSLDCQPLFPPPLERWCARRRACSGVGGETHRILRNALADARNLGTVDRNWEFWKSEVGKKKIWRVVASKRY
jgi:hypothetical protein